MPIYSPTIRKKRSQPLGGDLHFYFDDKLRTGHERLMQTKRCRIQQKPADLATTENPDATTRVESIVVAAGAVVVRVVIALADYRRR